MNPANQPTNNLTPISMTLLTQTALLLFKESDHCHRKSADWKVINTSVGQAAKRTRLAIGQLCRSNYRKLKSRGSKRMEKLCNCSAR
ncbi:hypothetical protein BaRGS_00004765 [Batillaria attramentaria]|uniref:Uncharacterized protein n=1 Tax=Batillaria attramentaria TaxID=370345 RepID=A0ABD0LY12_9CAEN